MARAAAHLREDIRVRMDRMYRPQVLFYDLTRKHYLLGRDRLIEGLAVAPGERVLEVGCGTGRNLVAIGRRWPGVTLAGLDAAAPMLASATRAVRKAALEARLVRGDAEDVTGAGFSGLDHIVASYCWSMVDDPVAAVRSAVAALRPGGTLHAVDFADQARLPAWFRSLLRAWLDRFHVRYRPEVEATLRELATVGDGELQVIEVAGRYALALRFVKSAQAEAAGRCG